MRLLLDAHLAPALAQQLRRHGVDAVGLRDEQGGNFRDLDDAMLLTAAAGDQRILVTYDRRTNWPRVKEWTETDRHHAGTIVVDENMIRPNDTGRLLRALLSRAARHGDEDWRDRAVFLRAEQQRGTP